MEENWFLTRRIYIFCTGNKISKRSTRHHRYDEQVENQCYKGNKSENCRESIENCHREKERENRPQIENEIGEPCNSTSICRCYFKVIWQPLWPCFNLLYCNRLCDLNRNWSGRCCLCFWDCLSDRLCFWHCLCDCLCLRDCFRNWLLSCL